MTTIRYTMAQAIIAFLKNQYVDKLPRSYSIKIPWFVNNDM